MRRGVSRSDTLGMDRRPRDDLRRRSAPAASSRSQAVRSSRTPSRPSRFSSSNWNSVGVWTAGVTARRDRCGTRPGGRSSASNSARGQLAVAVRVGRVEQHAEELELHARSGRQVLLRRSPLRAGGLCEQILVLRLSAGCRVAGDRGVRPELDRLPADADHQPAGLDLRDREPAVRRVAARSVVTFATQSAAFGASDSARRGPAGRSARRPVPRRRACRCRRRRAGEGRRRRSRISSRVSSKSPSLSYFLMTCCVTVPGMRPASNVVDRLGGANRASRTRPGRRRSAPGAAAGLRVAAVRDEFGLAQALVLVGVVRGEQLLDRPSPRRWSASRRRWRPSA